MFALALMPSGALLLVLLKTVSMIEASDCNCPAALSVIYSGTRKSVNVKARRSGAQDRIRLPCTLRLLLQLRALRLLSLPCMPCALCLMACNMTVEGA